MRKKSQQKMSLIPSDIEHPRAKELDRISKLLNPIPTITNMLLQDLADGVHNRHCGAQGMIAHKVIWAAIIRQIEGFGYGQPFSDLINSRMYRNFGRIGLANKGFKKSALCKNMKSMSPQTWESIDRLLTAYGDDKKFKKASTPGSITLLSPSSASNPVYPILDGHWQKDE